MQKVWGLVALLVASLWGSSVVAEPCPTAVVNRLGSSNADITVSTTAVTVLSRNDSRCRALIFNNATAANAMRCAPSGVTPTSTVGYLIPGGATLTLDVGSQQAWQCIRAAAADATVSTLEAVPGTP